MKSDEKNLPLPPVELFDLATGYQRAKTLFALVEFELPTLLAAQPLTTAQIARALKLHPLAADRFLNACVALGLLARDGETFRNAPLADAFLVKDRQTYLGDQFLRYDRASYPNWARLVERLRAWQPGIRAADEPAEADQGAAAMRAQHNLSVLVGNALAHAYDFSTHKLLLDVGGGTGGMSIGVCRLFHTLRAIIFDLSPIVETAQSFIQQNSLQDRIETQAGDFRTDDLPQNFDVALLANFLSVTSEAQNRTLLKKLYERLPSGGAIILSGWILDDARTSPLIPVLFCLEDISWQAPDVERTAHTYEGWLRDAGFTRIERKLYCPPTSMIVGRKAS